jgi:xanthine dehydrogenase/oxidase
LLTAHCLWFVYLSLLSLAAVQAFNASSRWLKKGIALTPVKYGFQLPGQQQSAMIQIFAPDGTIVLSHSGAEIGQGLTTKVLQCVAYSLGVDLSMIVNRPSSTDKIPNWTMTGGSSTSEAVCQAAMDACAKLNTILDKYRGNGKSWADVVNAAVAGDESLTATCIFSPKADPYPFTYYVWCAACTEVQVDVLSGDTNVLRTDIVYDCGQSLNPIVDIGQIEGAFVQGIGFFLTEETIFDPNTGRVVNNGTWDYKPPASQDIPIDLRVTLLPNLPNSAGILRSKGSGEPPYILAASVKFGTTIFQNHIIVLSRSQK